MGKFIRFLFTHAVAIAIGFGLGVYFLPILTEPPGPEAAKLEEMAAEAQYQATLSRNLRGSDFAHWGDGTISVSATQISHQGKLAPGPDYKLYLTKGLVDHEDTFDRANAIRVGDVKNFSGFILDVPSEIDVSAYDSVLVWCEAFSEFITAATYK